MLSTNISFSANNLSNHKWFPYWGLELLSFSEKWKKEIIHVTDYLVKGDCHIILIIIGSEDETLSMQKYLEKNGFLAVAIRPPTVPIGQSRIRITIKKTLNDEILNNFISILKAFKWKKLLHNMAGV